MPKICYDRAVRDRLTKSRNRGVIDQANAIITEYQEQGFDLTLRQLYYQFVARGLLKENTQKQYKRIGDIVNDGRLAGLIDWYAIVDRTRNLKSLSHWSDPCEIVTAVSQQFRVDKWARQPHRVEVWIEKDALIGVIQGVCQEMDVPYFSCRGYTSQSEMWGAGRRLLHYLKDDHQTPVVLHFGDHDPSGIDMSRDIRSRLELFGEGEMEVRRLALNMNQVEQYNPPPNPAKTTDARYRAYLVEHGDESWELDALDPRVLASLVRDEIQTFLDEDKWDAAVAEENAGKADLAAIAGRFDEVKDYLHNGA